MESKKVFVVTMRFSLKDATHGERVPEVFIDRDSALDYARNLINQEAQFERENGSTIVYSADEAQKLDGSVYVLSDNLNEANYAYFYDYNDSTDYTEATVYECEVK